MLSNEEKDEILNIRAEKTEKSYEEKWFIALAALKYISETSNELTTLTAISEMFKRINY